LFFVALFFILNHTLESSFAKRRSDTQMGRPASVCWFLRHAFCSDPGNLVVMLSTMENRLTTGIIDGVNEIGDPDQLRVYFDKTNDFI
jgi:hypothetical protein